VAVFEAFKGFIVLVAGCGLLSLVHEDWQRVAEHMVARLHLNPAHHTGQVFVEAANHLTDGRLRLLALFALAYSGMRFVEAYGLWHGRRWAEWFAVGSGGLYMVIEVFELTRGFNWLKLVTLVINAAVVLYLAGILRSKKR